MDPETITRTRRALHAVAETVLAGPQYRAAGTIRLRVHPGGFATRTGPDLRVVGAELVAGELHLPLRNTSCAGLAEAAGVSVGAPAGLYGDGSGVGPDEIVDADPEAAARLADCFAVGDAALRRVFPGEDPVIWPEHFDLAVTVDAVNYGVSLGDSFQPEPYAYVGPHVQQSGEFWNAPFGAAVTVRELGGPDAVAAFFVRGRGLVL